MAKIEMKGLNEYTQALSRLDRGLRDEVCGKAVYAGAKIVADRMKESINALPEGHGFGTPDHPLVGPIRKQKEGLVQSFGITKMRDDNGLRNVKLGFAGYNDTKTKRWPNGQPNAMVARAVERGTSFMKSNPFIKKTMSGTKSEALNAMRRAVEESIERELTR